MNTGFGHCIWGTERFRKADSVPSSADVCWEHHRPFFSSHSFKLLPSLIAVYPPFSLFFSSFTLNLLSSLIFLLCWVFPSQQIAAVFPGAPHVALLFAKLLSLQVLRPSSLLVSRSGFSFDFIQSVLLFSASSSVSQGAIQLMIFLNTKITEW